MRIAQVAPLYEAVPPKLYGGTERVVAFLTDELVSQGHEVTLFASGDSVTRARLVAACERSLRLDEGCDDDLLPHVLLLERVMQRASEFDVVHFHLDYLHFPLARRCRTPHLTTMHGRLDHAARAPLYAEFSELPLVSISDRQRDPLPRSTWLGTVYHGLPLQLHRYRAEPGEYFAFVGRIAPEKRVDRAIHIAKRLGVPLKIAAKISRADAPYFTREIEPLLDHPLIEFIGEIDERQKSAFLGNARALLFTIDWPEPFGLAMIEALACGTPVVAYGCGSVPEVIEHGVSGLIVNDLDAAVDAARRVGELDRAACRSSFERRFSAARMASGYLELYRRLIERAAAPIPRATEAA